MSPCLEGGWERVVQPWELWFSRVSCGTWEDVIWGRQCLPSSALEHSPAAWHFWEIAVFPEGKTGALCLFFSLCLFLSCFSPQLRITESLEMQLFAGEKAERNVQ